MNAATRLYTPEILALATSLAGAPYDADMPYRGQARSATCGSALEMSLTLDTAGRIEAAGVRALACAIGQASAAVFITGAAGRTPGDIALTLAAIERWLAGEAACPTWPGLEALAAAADYPARHGAILLPWKAALDALSPA